MFLMALMIICIHSFSFPAILIHSHQSHPLEWLRMRRFPLDHFYRYPGSPVRLMKVNLTASTNSTLEEQLIHKKIAKHILTIQYEPATSKTELGWN